MCGELIDVLAPVFIYRVHAKGRPLDDVPVLVHAKGGTLGDNVPIFIYRVHAKEEGAHTWGVPTPDPRG